MALAKMGMLNVTLWDYDAIESHNIPNQIFSDSMVGQEKVKALKAMVHSATGLTYKTKGRWDGEPLSDLVFSCVDNMSVRKRILENMSSGLFIETRMGVHHGQVFSIDPANPESVAFWKEHWVGDDVIEEKSACGSSLTIGATAQLLSSYAVWQGINYLNEEDPVRGLTISVKPNIVMEL